MERVFPLFPLRGASCKYKTLKGGKGNSGTGRDTRCCYSRSVNAHTLFAQKKTTLPHKRPGSYAVVSPPPDPIRRSYYEKMGSIGLSGVSSANSLYTYVGPLGHVSECCRCNACHVERKRGRKMELISKRMKSWRIRGMGIKAPPFHACGGGS